MRRKQLTYTQQKRLEKNQICPLCNKPITDNDDLMFTIVRNRRCKKYTFYHERCLANGKEQENTSTEKNC